MSSLEYANQKLYEAWLCLFAERDEPAGLAESVDYALTTLAPGSPAIDKIMDTLSDDDRADWQVIRDAWLNRESMDVERVERAIVRLDRAVMGLAANASQRLAYVL